MRPLAGKKGRRAVGRSGRGDSYWNFIAFFSFRPAGVWAFFPAANSNSSNRYLFFYLASALFKHVNALPGNNFIFVLKESFTSCKSCYVVNVIASFVTVPTLTHSEFVQPCPNKPEFKSITYGKFTQTHTTLSSSNQILPYPLLIKHYFLLLNLTLRSRRLT